jgi:hypothetical protein
LAEYQWANGIFTMSVIFIFASYDLSAALTELGVAVRLCDGHGRNEDCPSHPKQINTISTAAMHTPFPRWVKSPHYRAAALLSASPQ